MTQYITFIQCRDKEEADEYKNILDHPLYHFLHNIRIFRKFPLPPYHYPF